MAIKASRVNWNYIINFSIPPAVFFSWCEKGSSDGIIGDLLSFTVITWTTQLLSYSTEQSLKSSKTSWPTKKLSRMRESRLELIHRHLKDHECHLIKFNNEWMNFTWINFEISSWLPFWHKIMKISTRMLTLTIFFSIHSQRECPVFGTSKTLIRDSISKFEYPKLIEIKFEWNLIGKRQNSLFYRSLRQNDFHQCHLIRLGLHKTAAWAVATWFLIPFVHVNWTGIIHIFHKKKRGEKQPLSAENPTTQIVILKWKMKNVFRSIKPLLLKREIKAVLNEFIKAFGSQSFSHALLKWNGFPQFSFGT